MSRELLFENNIWQKAKAKLLEGKDLEVYQTGARSESKRRNMEVLLENQRKYLMENATAGSTASGNIATLNKVMLPLIRRVMPTVIANEIIGVQPMTGPVGQIHTLRARYADTVGSPTAVVAGTEALSPFYIARFYTGNLNSTTPRAAATPVLEGVGGQQINIQIVRETVEAKTRKIRARWTFEAAQEAQSQHGVDVEAEVMAVLAQEMTAEIDQEILLSLRSLATPTATFDQSNVSGTPTFVGDEHAALATLINYQSNLVAQRTRRGAANWCVVSNAALTVLQSATTSAFARTTEGVFEAPTNTKFVGTLNGAMRIYVDAYAANTEVVLLGYKGNGEVDAAAYYCPYIPLMSSGVVLDPSTFEPTVSFMTRYGYLELTNTANSFGNAADYLAAINVSNLKFY